MKLRFLGKESTVNDSPTVWDTDEDQFVLQGFLLDSETLAQIGDVPAGEAVIRVPKALMRHLPEGRGSATGQ
jgi:hypothetical protein